MDGVNGKFQKSRLISAVQTKNNLLIVLIFKSFKKNVNININYLFEIFWRSHIVQIVIGVGILRRIKLAIGGGPLYIAYLHLKMFQDLHLVQP